MKLPLEVDPCVFILCWQMDPMVSPVIPHLLVSTPWYEPFPLRVGGICPLLLTNRI